MNIPIGFVCAEIPDISSILSSKNGLSHFYEHMIIKYNDDISDKLFFDFNGYTDPRSLVFKGFTLPDVDIKKCIDFSYNFIVYPDISEDLIESERNVILTEIDNDESCINIDRLIKLSGIDKRCFINTLGTKRYVSKITRDDLYMCRDTILNKSEMVFHLYGCDDFMNKYVSNITELSNEVDINTYYRNSLKYFHVHDPKYGVYKYTKKPKHLYVSFVLDNYDFKKLCVLLIILSMMCDNYNFSMFNYLRSNGLCYSVNRRYIECTNRIVANLIIDVSPDKCEITKDYVVDYINNFKLIANNDNIEYAIRMIKLNDRLNIMNIEDYHDAYISFVRSRLNGVMDLYKSYESISVDDVRDMVKDITEDKLIIQYCS
jgi:hypothetical protein